MIFSFYKVSGHSMEPYLHEGDKVLTCSFLKISEGDVIVFKKGETKFIKRVRKIESNFYSCEGDNKHDSLDSKKLGPIPKKNILGKVVLKI
ncbi:MAG: S26 family signal peptidase [Candidatus Levyibacteriota bacterium]